MNIVPIPAEITVQQGSSLISSSSCIFYNDAELSWHADFLAQHIHQRFSLQLSKGENVQPPNENFSIYLSIQRPTAPPEWQECESYELNCDDMLICVKGAMPKGVLYGIQSLLQLMPLGSCPEDAKIPQIKIRDYPRFRWRGVMLDCGRHYFPPAFIKRCIDMASLYKLNVFHWHLTEDQGWRLEVKMWPKLQEIAAWRGSGDDVYGGYYTQEEIKDIVAYAAERFIDVVPEIELPGHCGAALAAYPYLSCTEAIAEVPRQWGVHADVYCAGKDTTFEFLEGVFSEVVRLFPYAYIHLGGDEVPKTRWASCPHCQRRIQEEGLAGEAELQSWFISRVARFLAGKGRRFIGWDEILEGGIPPNATVMAWRGIVGGIIAARHKHDVVMTPTSFCYFDYRQGATATWHGSQTLCKQAEHVRLMLLGANFEGQDFVCG